ncbi:hypothetical protein ACP70R_026057 [Stipagrostis hirtigluma subsp. patula]
MAPGPVVHSVTVLEQCHISPSPAPAAGQPRALPLTFFDLVFWDFPPVQRLFFYDDADLLGVPDFLLRELPLFKKSLAAALHHFYPLAGTLTCEMAEDVAPEVVFTVGDSVPLTVAVSGDDFHDLAGDHDRDAARLRPLLPPLPIHGGGSRSSSQGVLAVQVTVFPRAGICVGTTLHHAVADGSSYVHFMKTWAAIHRLGPDRSREAAPLDAPPLFDRGAVRDDAGLREAFVRDHRDLAAAGDGRLGDWDLSRRPDVVLATFRFTEKQLGRLGRHVESETSARCSPYALACGAAWAGIERARGGGGGGASSAARFGFVTGCKPRARPPIPANYFGNCLGLCRVEVEDAKRRNGLTAAAAAAAIWRAIEALAEEGQAVRDARGWVRLVREYAAARAVTVAGSPKLGVYAVDLGAPWGRPRKVEIASVERTGALALAESGADGGGGGIEVGLALPRAEMAAFRAFYRGLFDGLK